MITVQSLFKRALKHLYEWWPAYLAVASAAALRLLILLSTRLVPQIDGAYYLAQVKSLLAGNGLRFDDMPLLFLIQAAVVQVLSSVTSLTTDAATIAGVKLVDAVVPPLAAIPIYALWLRWSSVERRSRLAAITMPVLTAFSFSLVHMTGDLQKNSFAFVPMSFAIWAFDTAALRGRVRDWVLSGLALLGCALSHIGVFAAAVAFMAPSMLYRFRASAGSGTGRVRRAVVLVMLATGMIVLVYVLSLFIPKLDALKAAVMAPLSLLTGETVFTRLADGLRPEGIADAATVILAYAPLLGVAVLWLRRRPDASVEATLVGASVATGILAFPFLGGIDGLRLHQMAFIPAAVLLAWFAGAARPWVVKAGCSVMLSANILFLVPAIPQATIPAIAEDSYGELISLKEKIGCSKGTVIVARHGLEWWAAWAFDTDIVQTIGVDPDLWKRYGTVLLLQEIKVQDNASLRPGGQGRNAAAEHIEAVPPVRSAVVVFEGKWYRLSKADSVLDLGREFEGTQRAGAGPRPEPKKKQ
jgi:hypothetical protein